MTSGFEVLQELDSDTAWGFELHHAMGELVGLCAVEAAQVGRAALAIANSLVMSSYR
jgi:hypothetical protein